MVYAIVEKNFVPDVTTKITDTFGFDEMERTEATMQLLEVAKEAAKEAVFRSRDQSSAAAAPMRRIPYRPV